MLNQVKYGVLNLKNKKILGSISIVLFLLSLSFCLIPVSAPVVSAQTSTVLYDGSNPSWWSSGGTLSGTLGVSISPSTSIVEGSCPASLQVNLTSGSYGQIEVGHNYHTSPQNWSTYTYLSFYFYGLNSSNEIVVGLEAPNQKNLIDYFFTDNFLGWQQMNFPIQANTNTSQILVVGTPNLSDITEVGWFFYNEPYVYYIDNVTLEGAPTVSISPTSATLDVGQSQLFTATPSDGSGSYTGYQWYVNGSAQSGQTASTFSFVPASAGSYSVTATVTDSLNEISAQSNAATVTVNSAPTVTIAPGTATLDVGQSQLFTATASGGSGSYSGYQWYVNGSAQSGQTASTFSFAPVAAGSYSVTATVTDSLDATSVQSNAAVVTASVIVTPTLVSTHPLTVTATSSSGTSVTVTAGASVTCTATVSGGTAPYYYQWVVYVSPNSTVNSYLTGQTSAKVNVSQTVPGTYHYFVIVFDSKVQIATSNYVTLTVTSSSPTPSPTPTTTPTPTPTLTPTATKTAFVLVAVDLLIVVIVIIIVSIFIILAWHGRRLNKKTQQTQTT